MPNCLSRPCAFNFTIVALIISLLIGIWFRQKLPHDIKQVLTKLHTLEASYRPFPQPNPGPFVLVGFGGCTDVTVNALSFFNSLGVNPNQTSSDEREKPPKSSRCDLNSLDDIITEFSEMFASGAAAERYVMNRTLFNSLISRALGNSFTKTPATVSSLLDSAPRKLLRLGGNALVMAKRLAREGADVSLVARLPPSARSALPSNIHVLSAPSNFGLPEVPLSDVHLVLEFEKGSVWRNYTAPRANRYILIRDEENPRLSSLWPDLMSAWDRSLNRWSFIGKPIPSPDLFVIGGLQTMDNFNLSPDIRLDRIVELRNFLSTQLPRSTLVHFEMASFIETNFIVNLSKLILPYVDSIGVNEQELPNLASVLSQGAVIPHASISTPRVAIMLDNMREIWSILTDRSLPKVGPGRRRLSRIHLHTLGYQAIMVRRPIDPVKARLWEENFRSSKGMMPMVSEVGRAWPFNRAAAAKASLIANRHTCATSSIDPVLTRLLMDDSFAITADPKRWTSVPFGYPSSSEQPFRIHFNSTAPVSCWNEPEPSSLNDDGFKSNPRMDDSEIKTFIEICVAPVPVCSNVSRTVGAGDNISAGALRVQLISRASTNNS